MTNSKSKRLKARVLTKGQNRLLEESIKLLLGPSLGQNQSKNSEGDEKLIFLQDAFDAKNLDTEWWWS